MTQLVPFETTIWTIIKNTKNKKEAINEFVKKYKGPIASFLARKGINQQDLEDLTQEIFLRIFEDDLLTQADQSRGKFRTLILAVTEHVLNDYLKQELTQKRGGKSKKIPIETLEKLLISEASDELFDEGWVNNLISIALEKLKEESRGYYEAIKLYINHNGDYESIARELGKDNKTAREYFYKARARLIKELHGEIMNYCSSKQEYEEEIDYLACYFI